MSSILKDSFFQQSPHDLARDLLGCRLVRVEDNTELTGVIIETEVYGGQRDPASHADSGEPTARTRPMFGPPGTTYVYTIYGMYNCFNVVAPAGVRPSAILVRALFPEQHYLHLADRRNVDLNPEAPKKSSLKKLLSGPGKLCQAFDIQKQFNGHPLTEPPLMITEGPKHDRVVDKTPRIGLNPETVGDAVNWEWRYVLNNYESFLSRS